MQGLKPKAILTVMSMLVIFEMTHGSVLRREKVCPSHSQPVPTCPFPDPEFSVFFPHPTNCHWFYHCSNGVAYCKECAADLHWNVDLDTCDYPERAGCSANGNSTPLSTTLVTEPSTTESTAAPTTVVTQESNNCPAAPTPNCPFPDPEFSVFFPHPTDCNWFYHCSNGVAHCKECPDDLHWNEKLDTCDYPDRAGCSGDSTAPPTTLVPEPTTTESTAIPSVSTVESNNCPAATSPNCPFPDPEFSVFFPHPTDCNWFYHCSNGVAHCKECPDDLHWNEKLDTCDYPDRAGCSGDSTAPPTTLVPEPTTTESTAIPSVSTVESNNCPAATSPNCPFPDPEFSVFFPHPTDCNWFYHCSNGVAHCKECPDNLHWNVALDTCDHPDSAGCKGSESTVPPSTTRKPVPSTTKVPITTEETPAAEDQCPKGSLPQCPYPDPEYSVFFPHENDCHWFYHCSNGVAYCKVCPAGLHWNVKLDTCDHPERAGCVLN